MICSAVNVEPAHPDSSTRFSMGAYIFLDLSQDLTDTILLVADDMPDDSEMLMVTSSVLRICRLTTLKMLIGVELCTHVRRGNMHVYM